MLLEEVLSIPKKDIPNVMINLGEKVTFKENVAQLIKDYARKVPNGNPKWIKIANILETEENPSFSVLHIAGKGSAYPIGTVIIEIGPNEDLEVQGDILIPVTTNYIH